MKKRFLLVIFMLMVGCWLMSCGKEESESAKNETTSEEAISIDNSETEEKSWKSDALQEEIVRILCKSDNSLGYVIEKLSAMRSQNLMADKFLEEFEKTDYFSLNEEDKFFFDACVKYLLKEYSYEDDLKSVDDVINITSVVNKTMENGEKNPEYENEIYVKFDERNTNEKIIGNHNFGAYNDYVWMYEENGSIYIGDAGIYDKEGSTSLGKKGTLVLHMLDNTYYSDIISRNREFFEFLIEYRDEVYKTELEKQGTSGNKYGDSNTKCVVSGCTNTIATTGDTNCCVVHSNECLECKKFIDGDAMYCMDCLNGAITGKSSSTSNNSKCGYKYSDGSVCGSATNKYDSLCDKHFEKLNDIYNSFTN